MKPRMYWAGALALGMSLGISGAAMGQPVENAPDVAPTPDAVSPDAVPNVAPTTPLSNTPLSDLVTLRLKLRAGQRYRMSQAMQMKFAVLIPPERGNPARKMEMSNISTVELDYRVLYINRDGTMQVRLTYADMDSHISFKMDGKPMQVPPGVSRPFKAFIGKSIEMQLSPLGAISNVRGMDKLLNAAIEEAGPGLNEAQRRQLSSKMKATFGGKTFQKMIEQSGMAFPQEPVRLGDTWSRRVEMEQPLPIVGNIRRTLKARQNGKLITAENGTLSMGSDTASFGLMPIPMQMAITGNYQGTSVLDEATGFVLTAATTQRLSGKMTVTIDARGNKAKVPIYVLVTGKTTARPLL